MFSYYVKENSRIYILTTNKTRIEPSEVVDLFIEQTRQYEEKHDKTYIEEIFINEISFLPLKNKMECVKNRIKVVDGPFISLEINKIDPKTNKEINLVNFTVDNPGSFDYELKKIKNKNDKLKLMCTIESNKYKCEHFLKKIKNFSDSYIKKWGPEKNKNKEIISMTKDFEEIYNIVTKDKLNLIEPIVFSEYIEPLESLLLKIRSDNKEKIESLDIIKSSKNISYFMALLDSNTINEPINSLGTTLLMYFYYLSTEEKGSVPRIIEILLMYGADPAIKDMNDLTCDDYKTKGSILFN